jgi:hypothetical protein
MGDLNPLRLKKRIGPLEKASLEAIRGLNRELLANDGVKERFVQIRVTWDAEPPEPPDRRCQDRFGAGESIEFFDRMVERKKGPRGLACGGRRGSPRRDSPPTSFRCHSQDPRSFGVPPYS